VAPRLPESDDPAFAEREREPIALAQGLSSVHEGLEIGEGGGKEGKIVDK
jgi:hypothetical protein